MKKLIFLAAAVFPMILQAGQYVSIHGGTDFLKRTDVSNSGQKVGWAIGGFYGIQVPEKSVRAEIEAKYRESHHATEYKDGAEDQIEYRRYRSNHAWCYMANFAYDINTLSMYGFTPYLGAGLGLSQNVQHDKIKTDVTHSEKRRDTRFAYQGFVGFQYPVHEGLNADFRYVYHIGAAHQKNHGVTVGLNKLF